jgi:hypothetical protein
MAIDQIRQINSSPSHETSTSPSEPLAKLHNHGALNVPPLRERDPNPQLGRRIPRLRKILQHTAPRVRAHAHTIKYAPPFLTLRSPLSPPNPSILY